MRKTLWLVAVLGAWLSGCADYPEGGEAGFFVVTTPLDLVDVAPGNGRCETVNKQCSLRAAVQESNALPGPNTVQLPAGNYLLTLTVGADGVDNGASEASLETTGPLRLLGAEATTTVIDGNGDALRTSLWEQRSGELWMSDVTLANGGGGIVSAGGALSASAQSATRLQRVIVRDNAAFAFGGGISTQGTLLMEDSRIVNNRVDARGGGLGLVRGTAILRRVEVADNHASGGSGLNNSNGLLVLENCTFSGNQAGAGGGAIQTTGRAFMNNVTVVRNHSSSTFDDRAGGISNFGELRVSNSIIAENTAPSAADDCGGTPLISLGYNLIGNPAECPLTGVTTGNKLGVSARLGELLFNGGISRTHALLADSPALDAANPAPPDTGANTCSGLDQRRRVRPGGPRCDMGAHEQNASPNPSFAPPQDATDLAKLRRVL